MLGLMLGAAAIAAMPRDGGKDADRAKVLDDAVACRAITEDAARLACYDRTVAALDQAEASHQVTVLDRAQVQEARRSLFGFSFPKIKLFGGGGKDQDKADDIASIDTTVSSVSHDENGAIFFTTPEGARWHQLDDRPTFRVKPGVKVTIHRASLGSYFANFQGSPAIRVKREN